LLKRFKTLSIKIQIMVFFLIILALAFTALSLLSLQLEKKQIIAMTEVQMQDSARDVIEKASILRASVDSREYERKLAYNLSQQRSEYLARGYRLNQYIVSPSGQVQNYGNMPKLPLDAEQQSQIIKQKRGFMHIRSNHKAYALAYDYNLENQTSVILVLPESDYLKPVNNLRNSILLLSLFIMLAAALIILPLVKYLTRPIHALAEAAGEVEAGVLRAHSFPEGTAREITALAGSFGNMIKTIKDFVSNQKDVVLQLNQTSEELSQSSIEVKEESISISKQLEQINLEVNEQINSMDRIRSSVDNLQQSTLIINNMNQLSVNISQQIFDQSKAGRNSMAKVTQQIDGVYDSTMMTQTALQKLNQRVEEIAAFNASVEAIATQIKLLSLNATIEAARAGTAGRTFSIVAHEISKLSQDTYRFSQETANIISFMSEDFIALKSSFQTVFNEVEASSALITDSGDIFQSIYDKTTDNRQAINDVADECKTITEQINQLAAEERNIYDNSLQVSRSIPDMLNSALHQTQSTDHTLKISWQLVDLAGRLKALLASVNA